MKKYLLHDRPSNRHAVIMTTAPILYVLRCRPTQFLRSTTPMKPCSLNRLFYWISGVSCAVVLITLAAGHWPVQAAPAKPVTASQKKLDMQNQRVTTALTRVLKAKVSSPGGKMQLTVSPTARAA